MAEFINWYNNYHLHSALWYITLMQKRKGKEGIGRSLFCTVKNNEVVILHSFVKKTNKTLKKDLDLARQRMKEVL